MMFMINTFIIEQMLSYIIEISYGVKFFLSSLLIKNTRILLKTLKTI